MNDSFVPVRSYDCDAIMRFKGRKYWK